MEQGEIHSLPLGEMETNSYLSGETDLAPPGSGEAEHIPQPSGETEPAFKASGETEFIPWPSGETEPVPMASGETEINLEPSGEAELSPKGVGRGGTKLLSLEQGMKRRPYASRSFSHSVVIGSTFWGTSVLGPRHTSSSLNWKSCSPHLDLQLCQLRHELDHHGLGV